MWKFRRRHNGGHNSGHDGHDGDEQRSHAHGTGEQHSSQDMSTVVQLLHQILAKLDFIIAVEEQEPEGAAATDIRSFIISQIAVNSNGGTMNAPAVGQVSGYAAQPLAADGSVRPLPATSSTPSWTVSDTTIATAVVDSTDPSGLTIKLTGVAQGQVTLSVSAKVPSSTDPSGFIIAAGSLAVTIGPGGVAVGDVVKFGIGQIS